MNILSGSLKEVMDNALHNLRNAEGNNYLTARLKGKVNIVQANYRGFVVALDYTTNASGGYMNPRGGKMVTTSSADLDTLTCNYQYVQFGHELDNENMANSKSGLHVGASAKALATTKELERRLEFEEWFFCRGDGTQVIADITAGVSVTATVAATINTSGARDGAGAWMIRKGQRIRIYNSAINTLKTWATVTAKASNKEFTIVPDTTVTIVDTDKILPEGDPTSPSTVGVKGVPYIVKAAGAYFNKTMGAVPSLQATIDSTTTTLTRVTMERLWRHHNSIRNGGTTKTTANVSPAMMSSYYEQFYAGNTPQVNIIGGELPKIDNGAESREYTHYKQKINEFLMYHPSRWDNLDYSSFVRLTVKEAGPVLVPGGEYVMKLKNGEYANAQQKWSDDYLEYMSPNPALNSGMNALTFTGLPLLCNSAYTG